MVEAKQTRKLTKKEGVTSLAERRAAMYAKLSPDLATSSTPPGEAPIRNLLPRVIIDGASGMSQAKFFNKDTEETVAELECTILAVRWHRMWYKVDFSDEGSPPACVSVDNKNGFAQSHEDVVEFGVGGDCASCPMRGRDRGQCQQRAAIFATTNDFDSEVIMVDLPPTSVFPLRKFLQTQEMSGYTYPFEYKSKIGFTQKKTGEYTTWRIDPAMVAPAEDNEALASMELLTKIGPMLRNPEQLRRDNADVVDAEVSSVFDADIDFE